MIAIIVEGGIVSDVITDDKCMIGKQIMVVDYDLEEKPTVTYQEIKGSRIEVGALKSLHK